MSNGKDNKTAEVLASESGFSNTAQFIHTLIEEQNVIFLMVV